MTDEMGINALFGDDIEVDEETNTGDGDVEPDKKTNAEGDGDEELILNIVENSDVDLSEGEIEDLVKIIKAYNKVKEIDVTVKYLVPIIRDEIRDLEDKVMELETAFPPGHPRY